MVYSEKEIVRSYQNAVSKKKQIKILAELNVTTKDAIVKVLEDNGVMNTHATKTCKSCGKTFVGNVRSYKCDECKEKAKIERSAKLKYDRRKKKFDAMVCEWLKENNG